MPRYRYRILAAVRGGVITSRRRFVNVITDNNLKLEYRCDYVYWEEQTKTWVLRKMTSIKHGDKPLSPNKFRIIVIHVQ